jgi:hypothetical protein
VQVVVSSLDKCIKECALYNQENRAEIQLGDKLVCNSVCGRNTFDISNYAEGGRCFESETRNLTGNAQPVFDFPENRENVCDSAALIIQEF